MVRAKDFTRQQLKKCVDLYLKTDMAFNGCARALGVSKAMFPKLIERAVIERVATDEEVIAISDKAASHCYEYGGEGGARIAKAKYARLRAERLKYQLTVSEKERLTIRYAMGKANLMEFCRGEYMPMDMAVEAIESSIKDDKRLNKRVLSYLVADLIDDPTAGSILVNLDHLLDIRYGTKPQQSKESNFKQISFWDT